MADALPSVRVVKAASIVGTATMVSRITGFVRDIFIAALLGAGPLAEIFVIAFRLPNLFRRLFAEGAFNAAFVPLFSERLEAEGLPAALEFAGRILSVLLAFLTAFTVLSMVFMPGLVLAIAQGFSADAAKFDQAVYYARIAFPYLFFISLLSLFAGVLNATGRFLAAAFAPVLLNIVLIGAALAALMTAGAPLDYLIWGVSLAGVAQFVLVVFAARRAGLKVALREPRRDPYTGRFFTLLVPGILAAGIGQINLLIGTSIATAQAGAAAWLYYADRLYQLPMGVIGVALAVALLPDLTRRIARADLAGAHASQDLAVTLAMLLTLPAAFGLYVLADPIVNVLFERGAFTPEDTAATAAGLRYFCFGLPAFVLVRALQPSFFARQDTRSPLIDGAVGVAANITLSLALFGQMGHVAIALASSVACWLTLLLTLVRLTRRGHWRPGGKIARALGVQIAACLVMAGVLGFAAQNWVPLADFADHAFAVRVGLVAGLVGLGSVVFAAVCFAGGGLRDLRGLRDPARLHKQP
ncbi:MAG TPA: murein biosynthesis integral membrane protein MurJ [Rhodobiaceae bacterium]|nr:murein biosynthesis integral membrane protein MurJ [Rhodobiaceae bacterium]